MTRSQTEGRKQNAAQPLGERSGTSTEKDTLRTGRKVQERAGPEGGDPRETASGGSAVRQTASGGSAVR